MSYAFMAHKLETQLKTAQYTIKVQSNELHKSQYEIARLLYIIDRLAEIEYISPGAEPYDELNKYSDMWDRYAIHKDDEHSGDCTREAHTCLRCFYEGYMSDAKEIMERGYDKWWNSED